MLKQWKDFSSLLNDFYSISFIILCSMTFEMEQCCKFHAKCNGIECKVLIFTGKRNEGFRLI